jgi:two-component system response regulator AtoC
LKTKLYKIFSVEDDSIYRRLIQHRISMNNDIDIESFADGNSLLQNIYKKPHVLILDLNLPDLGGIEVVNTFKEKLPDCLIIVLSSQDKVELVVNTLKSGVYDYILKDDYALDRLWLSVNNAIKHIELNNEIHNLRNVVSSKVNFSENIKGLSNEMREVFRLMEKTITNNIPVEIYGETGTGKELVAKAIHFNSLRKAKPYIALNVAAFPKELIESELFGYEKGAFTGALHTKPGKLEEANGGTLFLDEISEMDASMQAKLLRAIQEMEVTRLGSNKPVKLNFRIIIATHKNLLQEVKEGRFREDLYYRLMGMKIELPPLRKRGNDIIALANHFITTYSKLNKTEIKQLTNEAKSALLKYRFPGNVRELKAIIETAYVMSENEHIDFVDLQLNEVNLFENLISQNLTLEEYTIKIIEHFLSKNNQNVLKTAKDLNIGKTTIYRYINEGKIILK